MKTIAVINDSVRGSMGEKVFWQYILDYIPQTYPVDKKILNTTNSFEEQARKFIKNKYPQTNLIIQNGTFINIIDEKIFTILFVQDNLRKMKKKSKQQEDNLKKADMLVTNSSEIQDEYSEFKFRKIYIGTDTNLFKPRDKKLLRKEFKFKDKKIGIFVGDFSEVKGWSRVRRAMLKFPEILWIVVSKNEGDPDISNSKTFIRTNQRNLSRLLGCADFFILGSPVETQCLSAIEANLCGIPVVMNNTGIYRDIKRKDRDKLGFFDGNFENNIEQIFAGEFKNTRSTIIKYGVDIKTSMSKWQRLIKGIK